MRKKLIENLKKMVIKDCNVQDLTPEQISDTEIIIGGRDVLRLDSLDAVEIVSSLERHFAIRLESAGDSRKVFKSFIAMADYVEQNASPERLDAFLV